MSLFDLVTRLREPSTRWDAACRLASLLGVEQVLLFVHDAAPNVLIPAPGMPQTMRGGASWREFLRSCPSNGRHIGDVDILPGRSRPAVALACEGAAMILVGNAPAETELRELERVLPLLAALLRVEQDALLAQQEAEAARDAVRSAETLARALDAARGDAAALNAELREAHRRKDEFLAMLGHELRNPLAPLVSAVHLLKLQGAGKAAPAALVDIMSRQTAQLSRLVEDLLDVSRVSRGRIELRREPLDLREVLASALEESGGLITANRHRVVQNHHETELFVDGDHARLVQVFGNLLNNAAKYTDPGGTITITSGSDGTNAFVSIADNGIGIAPEMQSRIFEIFARAPDGSARSSEGLGLGLALVRMLVELHGGRVEVRSAGAGSGSTFTVTLPRISKAPARITVQRKAPLSCERKLCLMIVDDNRDAADSLAALLRNLGHECEVSYDAQNALVSPLRKRADLVLLDIRLPDMSGLELARRLRPSLKPGALLAALTGYGADSDKHQSVEAGFDRHLVKPITLEALQELLRGVSERGAQIRGMQ